MSECCKSSKFFIVAKSSDMFIRTTPCSVCCLRFVRLSLRYRLSPLQDVPPTKPNEIILKNLLETIFQVLLMGKIKAYRILVLSKIYPKQEKNCCENPQQFFSCFFYLYVEKYLSKPKCYKVYNCRKRCII